MTVTSSDYLAGFWDADASLNITRLGSGYRREVVVVGVDPAPMRVMRHRWGGALRQETQASGHRRALWRWVATGTVLDAAVTELLPYLVERRDAATLLMDWPASRPEQAQRMEQIRRLTKRGRAAKHWTLDDAPAELPAISADYLAGMIDGDGMIGLRTGTKPTPLVRVCTVPVLIPAACQASWGGRLYVNAHPNAANSRPAWVWEVSGSKSATPVLTAIRDALIVKRRRAEIALEWAATVGPKDVCRRGHPWVIYEKRTASGRRHHCMACAGEPHIHRPPHVPADVETRRSALRAEMTALNHRGTDRKDRP